MQKFVTANCLFVRLFAGVFSVIFYTKYARYNIFTLAFFMQETLKFLMSEYSAMLFQVS